MKLDVTVSCPVSDSPRARQLEGMFDVPRAKESSRSWSAELPLEARPWNVGLIVGPSGSGKSTAARKLFGDPVSFDWGARSVIDDFPAERSMDDISAACQAVGFNTIPAWLHPYGVLSTGEKFRVELARMLLHDAPIMVMDEFTSVVDRQVAQIGSHAIAKYVRKRDRKFVAVSCHRDIVDWLQPDWIFEPATCEFQWRELQRRPQLDVAVSPVPYSAWRLFAPFHYLTNDLHRAARCWCLFVGDEPAAFVGVLHRPHPRADDIMGISRLVCLPDWQGLGLGPRLSDTVASVYAAIGKRVHVYPAHPHLIRVRDKSPNWALIKRPGIYSPVSTRTSTLGTNADGSPAKIGGRPCAVFRYAGPPMDRVEALRLLAYWNKAS